MTLTKAKLIDQVRKQVQGLKTWEAPRLVERVLELIKETLAGGEEVLISGFGKFLVREKNPRRGRNPRTGEALLLRKRRVVTFKPATTLRARLNPPPPDPDRLWEAPRAARRRQFGQK